MPADLVVQCGLGHPQGLKTLNSRHVLRCDCDPDAPVPAAFEKLLNRILPDPAVRVRVQEYIGHTLFPDARFELAQLWPGSGANGKGSEHACTNALSPFCAPCANMPLSAQGAASTPVALPEPFSDLVRPP